MKKVFLAILLGFTAPLFSQTVIINNESGPNSKQTENAMKNAQYFNSQVAKAIEEQDLKKARYYLDQWDHCASCVNGNYWKSEAEYSLAIGDSKKAKRYYMRAYKKFACYECKEKADNIN